ncbi:MAG: futalosine hydrolase [Bacteroidales bacterium]|jgi:futalosine hydrolase|nr:futalosine hydrolase [Bacteroidales bacterium]
MRLLFTAATAEELHYAEIAYERISPMDAALLDVEFAVTGIGVAATCYNLTKILNSALLSGGEPYDLVVNIGIAGSYSQEFPIGSVAHITVEQFGDMGIETRGGFQTLFDYAMLDANTLPFVDGLLKVRDPYPVTGPLEGVRDAIGITFQTLTGILEQNLRRLECFSPQIESMEGAAFFYVCLMEKVPFTELRAVSNEVGERDKSRWNIRAAFSALENTCTQLLTKASEAAGGAR